MARNRRYELRDPALNEALEVLVEQAAASYGHEDPRVLDEVRQLVVTEPSLKAHLRSCWAPLPSA